VGAEGTAVTHESPRNRYHPSFTLSIVEAGKERGKQFVENGKWIS
jgi:hypothetical protein